VDHGQVQREVGPDGTRLGLLRVTRAFARELLDGGGEG